METANLRTPLRDAAHEASLARIVSSQFRSRQNRSNPAQLCANESGAHSSTNVAVWIWVADPPASMACMSTR